MSDQQWFKIGVVVNIRKRFSVLKLDFGVVIFRSMVYYRINIFLWEIEVIDCGGCMY